MFFKVCEGEIKRREGEFKKRLHVCPNSSATFTPLFFKNSKSFFNFTCCKLFVFNTSFLKGGVWVKSTLLSMFFCTIIDYETKVKILLQEVYSAWLLSSYDELPCWSSLLGKIKGIVLGLLYDKPTFFYLHGGSSL